MPRNDKWELSLFLGGAVLGDKTFVTPIDGGGTQTVGINSEGGILAGARITENLKGRLAAEMEYAVSRHDLIFSNLRPDLPILGAKQAVHKVSYSVLFHPYDRNNFRPFLSVGVGASYFQISSGSENAALSQGVNLEDRWKFAFSYGGGAKLRLSRDWGVRFDVRDHVTSVPDYGLPRSAPSVSGVTGAGLRPDGNFHNWQVSGGLIYFLKIQ